MIRDKMIIDSIDAGNKPQGIYADSANLYVALGNYNYHSGDGLHVENDPVVEYKQGILFKD